MVEGEDQVKVYPGRTHEQCAFTVFHWMLNIYWSVWNWEADQILPLSTASAMHGGGNIRDMKLVHLNKTKKKKNPWG